MPTGFHPHSHLHSLPCQIAIKLLRFLAMCQSSLLQFSSFPVQICNLLGARVIVTSYNQHVRLLSLGPWLVGTTKVYSGMGADIVMESLRSLTSLVALLVALGFAISCHLLRSPANSPMFSRTCFH